MSKATTGLFIEHVRGIVQECIERNTDKVVLLTGVEGTGKSGVAHIAMRLMDPDFDPELQVHWTVPRYIAAEFKLPPGRPLHMDELIKAGTSYRFMAGDNTEFADRLFINRERRHPQILVHPDFKTVSPLIKEHRAWYWWHVVKRYERHAVVKVYQLRDGERVYEKPRYLWSATIPKPHGPLWERECQLKEEFGRSQGKGTVQAEDAFERVVSSMEERLSIFEA